MKKGNAVTIGRYGEFAGKVSANIWPALKSSVLAGDLDLQYFIDNPLRIQEAILRGFLTDKSITISNSQWTRVRKIMGRNFFGVEEAVKYFGVNPTCQQLVTLSEIPFPETLLEESKNTHVLVAVFPLSILEIRAKVDSVLFRDQSWYKEEFFSNVCNELSWQLIRKTPVLRSISKNWQQQQELLGKNNEVPEACLLVYMIIGHYLASGEHLFERIDIRTSSISAGGLDVIIGFRNGGLAVRVALSITSTGITTITNI